MITITYHYDGVDKSLVDEGWTNSICNIIFKQNGHKTAQVSIIFSDDSKLSKLKKEYFDLDLLTDTITFNLEEKGDPIEGEIYISLDRISENCKIYNQTFINELKRVIIHSFLHLIGFEDETNNDKIIMTKLEEKYISHKKGSHHI